MTEDNITLSAIRKDISIKLSPNNRWVLERKATDYRGEGGQRFDLSDDELVWIFNMVDKFRATRQTIN